MTCVFSFVFLSPSLGKYSRNEILHQSNTLSNRVLFTHPQNYRSFRALNRLNVSNHNTNNTSNSSINSHPWRSTSIITGLYIFTAGTLLLSQPQLFIRLFIPSLSATIHSHVHSFYIRILALAAQLFGLYYLGESLLPKRGFLLISIPARIYLSIILSLLFLLTLPIKSPILIVLSVLNLIGALSMWKSMQKSVAYQQFLDECTSNSLQNEKLTVFDSISLPKGEPIVSISIHYPYILVSTESSTHFMYKIDSNFRVSAIPVDFSQTPVNSKLQSSGFLTDSNPKQSDRLDIYNVIKSSNQLHFTQYSYNFASNAILHSHTLTLPRNTQSVTPSIHHAFLALRRLSQPSNSEILIFKRNLWEEIIDRYKIITESNASVTLEDGSVVCCDVVWSLDGKRWLIGVTHGRDLRNSVLISYGIEENNGKITALEEWRCCVNSLICFIRIASDMKRIVVVDLDGFVHAIDSENGKIVFSVDSETKRGGILGINQISHDHLFLLTTRASNQNAVLILNLKLERMDWCELRKENQNNVKTRFVKSATDPDHDIVLISDVESNEILVSKHQTRGFWSRIQSWYQVLTTKYS